MNGSLVIATRDRPDVVARSVRHVREQLPEGWELIVVDDGTQPALGAEAVGDARLLRLDASVGRGAARNHGAMHARGDIIGFMDDDIFPTSDCLERLLGLVEEPGIWVAPVERTVQKPGAGGASEPSAGVPRVREVQIAPTSLLLTWRESFDAVGGFPTDLTRLVDYEISIRARGRGHRLLQDEGAVAVHEDYHHSFRALCLREHDSVALLPVVWSLHFPEPPGPDEVYFAWFWENYHTRRWPIRIVSSLLRQPVLWRLFTSLVPRKRPRPEALARLLFRVCAVRGAFHGLSLVEPDYRADMLAGWSGLSSQDGAR